MQKEKILGIFSVVFSIIVLSFYFFAMFISNYQFSFLIIKITVFLLSLAFSLLLLWIGYTLITTPSPSEEIKKIEEEILNEIKNLEMRYKEEDKQS